MTGSGKWTETVLAVAKVTNGLDQRTNSDLPLLVEGSKVFLKGNATKLIQDTSPESTITIQRSCDCTPIKLRQHYQKKTWGRLG